MKIVVVGKKNHLHWDEDVVDAFKELDHDVLHFQVNQRPLYIQTTRGLLKGLLGKNKGSEITDKIYANNIKKQLEKIKPDIIIVISACFLSNIFYETFKELKNKPKIFAWEGDGGLEQNHNKYLAEYVDVMLSSTPNPVESNEFNFSNIFYLNSAVNHNEFKDLDNKRKKNVYFCGNLNNDRNLFFSKLKDYELVLRGVNWDKLNEKNHNFNIINGMIDRKQLLKDYNSYFAALNYHQKEVASFMGGMNIRSFEILATKTLLINDYRDNIEDLFDIEKEICVYRNTDELKEILDKLKKYPQEFESIRENGYKRVLAEHTYVHRMKKVIDIYNQL